MSSPAEQLQHPARIRPVYRFAENMTIADDAGIGPKHNERVVIRIERLPRRPDGLGLLFGKPLNVRCSSFIRQQIFVQISRLGCEDKAGLGQQFVAPGRGRSEDEHTKMRLTSRLVFGKISDGGRLSGILAAKGINHTLDIWGNGAGHDWPWWEGMVVKYL